jgi:cytochrome P450
MRYINNPASFMAKQNYHFPPAVPQWRSFANATKFIHNPIPVLNQHIDALGSNYTFYMGGMKKSIVTSDAEFIQHVLQKSHRKYEKSYIQTKTLADYIGHGLLTSTGAYWLKQRRLIQPGFQKPKLASLTNIMNLEIADAFNQLSVRILNHNRINIYEEMNHLTFRIVAKSLFSTGIDNHGLDKLGNLITTVQEFIIREVRQPFFHFLFRISGLIRKHVKMARETQSIIQRVIDDRRKSTSSHDDLLDMLLNARYDDGSRMTDQQLIEESLILFVAGHETTANAMAWTFYLLTQHPDVLEKVRMEARQVLNGRVAAFEDLRNLNYARQVIEESMRLYPPAWVSDRVSLDDDHVCGYHIPRGTIIILYYYGLHHNKDYWSDPEVFDPDRFSAKQKSEHTPFAYAPFGGGPRLCIGNHFAMMEMQLILCAFVQNYEFELAQANPELQPLITLRPRGGIHLKLKKRPS